MTKKMNNIGKKLASMIIIFFGIFTNGQTFLSKYPKLTKKNLPEFFADWKAYSDSVKASNVIADSVLEYIINYEYAIFWLEGSTHGNLPIYKVIPRSIKVERYYLDIDTVMARLCHGFPDFIPDLRDDQFTVDSITPVLPHKGLYLTSEIDRTLSNFIGGLISGSKISKINKRNVSKLKEYIPVDYGHWGGYWWFTSFPLITYICYANNLIAVMRRTSWCTGDVIWYIKESGKFARCPKPIISWIE